MGSGVGDTIVGISVGDSVNVGVGVGSSVGMSVAVGGIGVGEIVAGSTMSVGGMATRWQADSNSMKAMRNPKGFLCFMRLVVLSFRVR